MTIKTKDIEHVASLAHLDVNNAGFERLAQDMQEIVAMVNQLQQLDLDLTANTMDINHKNAFREDIAMLEYTPDQLIEPNAPDFRAGGIVVPRVVE